MIFRKTKAKISDFLVGTHSALTQIRKFALRRNGPNADPERDTLNHVPPLAVRRLPGADRLASYLGV
jgi:hypothetical protein